MRKTIVIYECDHCHQTQEGEYDTSLMDYIMPKKWCTICVVYYSSQGQYSSANADLHRACFQDWVSERIGVFVS